MEARETASLLRVLCASRQLRKGMLGDHFACETRTETVEGLAEAVACLALKSLDAAHFAQRLRHMAASLRAADASALDVRRSAYASGAALYLSAKQAGYPLYHTPGRESRTVYELLAEELAPLSAAQHMPPDPLWERLVSETVRQRENGIRVFQENAVRTEGDFTISGYDPMNMYRSGDRLYARTFLRLTENGTGREITLTDRTLLEMKPGSPDRARAYWR